MPSVKLGYVPGSGFMPLISGNPWSGINAPMAGIQIRADRNNSGSIYVSLSGAFQFSGQMSTLVASGGPTINSGAMLLSGGINSGRMDGMQVGPGDSYFVARAYVPNLGQVNSGHYGICVGCDPECSGLGRVYFEVL